MKYLNTYELFEAIDIDDYKKFISKWKRSGGYISRGDIKRLDDMGIKHEKFNKLKDDIEKCYSFFDKNDFYLLSDLMLDAFDESPLISERTAKYSFGILCKSDYSDGVNIEYPVSRDSENKPIYKWNPKPHDSIIDKDAVLENLITEIITDRDKAIKKEESELDSLISRKNKGEKIKDYNIGISRTKINHLKKYTPFRTLTVSPIIYIDTLIDEEEVIDWRNRNDRYTIKQDFFNHTKISIIRYLQALGYGGGSGYMDSMVNVSEDSDLYHQPQFRTKVTITLR